MTGAATATRSADAEMAAAVTALGSGDFPTDAAGAMLLRLAEGPALESLSADRRPAGPSSETLDSCPASTVVRAARGAGALRATDGGCEEPAASTLLVDDPSSGAAQATPRPPVAAAPIPSATASPPTRPMQLDTRTPVNPDPGPIGLRDQRPCVSVCNPTWS